LTTNIQHSDSSMKSRTNIFIFLWKCYE